MSSRGHRVRLCFVVTSDVTAGAFLRGYVTELVRSGISVDLVCSPGPGLDQFRNVSGVTLHPRSMNREPSPISDLRAFLGLVVLFVRLRPHAIVYATPKASLLASCAGFLAGIRVRIYELWGLRLETAKGVQRPILFLLERLTMRLSTSVVANSKSLLYRARGLRLMSAEDGEVLGPGSSHGIDTDFFSSSASRPGVDSETAKFLSSSRGFTIGYVGRLHPDKGVDLLIQAIRTVKERGVAIRALLVGGDEGAQLPDLSGLDVHLVGQVRDVRPYVAEMDLLVLMSLREGFPNVVLEAAGMGIPAIVADSTGAKDAVVDGVTGYIVPAAGQAELEDRIMRLENDSAELDQLGKQARMRAVEEFSASHICRLHVQHYLAQICRSSPNAARKALWHSE
ncbi:glycosyltransferase family 4 protein [Microbacterium sp. NPDC058345]|uniref:glycosyltransferase family 4 protein n=1 Tax=Microbacterium sp. NPDC058345 TaxID=3346455 RepID=UPI00365B4CDE